MDLVEVIKKRRSWRTFTKETISGNYLAHLIQFIDEMAPAPFGSKIRFKIISGRELSSDELKGLGTYGVIKNCSTFIVGAVQKGDHALVDFGHAMERIVLKTSQMGLQSCWLGGTFSRSNFSESIELEDNEILPAVIAIGHGTEKRGVVDNIIAWTAKSKNRHPSEKLFFNTDFSAPIVENEEIYFELVRLAPSASNKQPWRVVKHGDDFDFYLHRDAKYTKNLDRLRLVDLQQVDMGIALSHFEIGAKSINKEISIEDRSLPDYCGNEYMYSVCLK